MGAQFLMPIRGIRPYPRGVRLNWNCDIGKNFRLMNLIFDLRKMILSLSKATCIFTFLTNLTCDCLPESTSGSQPSERERKSINHLKQKEERILQEIRNPNRATRIPPTPLFSMTLDRKPGQKTLARSTENGGRIGIPGVRIPSDP